MSLMLGIFTRNYPENEIDKLRQNFNNAYFITTKYVIQKFYN